MLDRAIADSVKALLTRDVPPGSMTVLRVSIGLEHIGDCAAAVAREAVQHRAELTPRTVSEPESMAGQAREMLGSMKRLYCFCSVIEAPTATRRFLSPTRSWSVRSGRRRP